MKIIVVDDSHLVLDIIKESLPDYVELHTHQSPFGVGALVLRVKPDLVVLDLHMPGLGGVAIAKLLFELDPSLHIVFLSSERPSVLDKAVKEAGVADYIIKDEDPGDAILEYVKYKVKRDS